MENTDGEKVEVLVGVVFHDQFHGKRLPFTGKEVDAYDTGESGHVLYECGPGRYRIFVSRFPTAARSTRSRRRSTRPVASPTGFSARSRRRRDGCTRSPSPAISLSKT